MEWVPLCLSDKIRQSCKENYRYCAGSIIHKRKGIQDFFDILDTNRSLDTLLDIMCLPDSPVKRTIDIFI